MLTMVSPFGKCWKGKTKKNKSNKIASALSLAIMRVAGIVKKKYLIFSQGFGGLCATKDLNMPGVFQHEQFFK